MSLTSIVVYAGFPLPATLVIAAVTGLGSGLAEIAFAGRIQVLAEPARSRAFGLSASTESAGFGSGMMLGAFLLGAFTPLTVLTVVTLAGTALAALFAAVTMTSARRTEAAGD